MLFTPLSLDCPELPLNMPVAHPVKEEGVVVAAAEEAAAAVTETTDVADPPGLTSKD